MAHTLFHPGSGKGAAAMTRVVVRTDRYKGLLREWAAGRSRRMYVHDVMALLSEVAMRENAVYRHAPKLRALALRLRETPQYRREVARLRRFLRVSGYLHIDGYVRFRLGVYNEMLDILSYRLIKKLRAGARRD